jgi:hypothetical protein
MRVDRPIEVKGTYPGLTQRMTYELFYESIVSFYSKTLMPKMRHYFS